MAQDIELSDNTTTHDLGKTETRSADTEHSGVTPTGRKLLRIGILTLGVLCIIQATLNISLRLAAYSKEETDRFPLSSSVIADECQIDQFQQNSTQSCPCCNNLLRSLQSRCQALKTKIDSLKAEVIQLTSPTSGSGSGLSEDVYIN